jgi:hypothetical protein
MASAKQLAANRANAEKSTGPRTEAGKRIARMNSTTHGLSGHTVLKTPEQDAAYKTYYHRLMPDLAPANAIEQDFAERIVHDSWRIHHASAIESNLYAMADPAFDTGNAAQDDALNDAHTYQLNDRAINLLSLYQQRLQRSIHRDLEMLRKMQKDRKAAGQIAAKQSAPTLQLIDKPAPQPVIGSVCPAPLLDPAPPPPAASSDPSEWPHNPFTHVIWPV